MKFGSRNILNLEKNIHTIKSSNFLKTPNKKTVNINNPFNSYFTKELYQRRNKYNFNNIYNMKRNHNINDNNIRVKIISQIFNNLYNKVHKKRENNPNIFKILEKGEEYNNLINKNNTIITNRLLPHKNYFDSDKNILEKSPILKKESNSQDEIDTSLIRKNALKRNFPNNNYSNNAYNSINAEKNFSTSSKIYIIPKIIKTKKVDSKCQTNLSAFKKEDSDEDTEEENKKEIISLANKAIFPSLYINQKKRNNIFFKNKNNIYNRNNILSMYNSRLNIFRGKSYDANRDKDHYNDICYDNKLKVKKLLIKNKISLNLNKKKFNQDKKSIGLVNQLNLEFKINKKSNS